MAALSRGPFPFEALLEPTEINSEILPQSISIIPARREEPAEGTHAVGFI